MFTASSLKKVVEELSVQKSCILPIEKDGLSDSAAGLLYGNDGLRAARSGKRNGFEFCASSGSPDE